MYASCTVTGGLSEADLSSLGTHRKDARVERRIIDLRLISSGMSTTQAAKTIGVTDRTLRLWVDAFNRDGVASLLNNKYHGGTSYLTSEEEEEVAEAVRSGLPPEMKVEVWRGWALRDWIRDRFGVEYSESGIYFLLHRLGFSSLMPRPVHPDSDGAAHEEFKKTLPRTVALFEQSHSLPFFCGLTMIAPDQPNVCNAEASFFAITRDILTIVGG